MTADALDRLGDRLFTDVPEAAAILGCDERTLRKEIRAGRVPHIMTGRQYRVRVSWLREEAGMAEPQPAAGPDLDELADRVADRLMARLGRLLGAALAQDADGHGESSDGGA